MKILCGIVTYNPDMNRLCENIYAVLKQCKDIIIYDNASDNYKDIIELAYNNNIIVINNEQNNGIAQALKTIMQHASEYEYDWVLTLDQDSVIQPGLIKKYKEYIDVPDVGIMTCKIMDRNFVESTFNSTITNYEGVEMCITSGSFTNVKAYQKTVGYDPFLFIDKVDYDICYSFRDVGYKIIKINYEGLLHEVGHGKNVNFFGIKKTIFNHPAWRVYYMTRNSIYIAKKHKSRKIFLQVIRSELGRLLLIILFETDKWNKIHQAIKGVRDGFSLRSYSNV